MFGLIIVLLLPFNVDCELVNSKVTRVVNLESQLVKTKLDITLLNLNEYRVSSFLFITENRTNLAYFRFKDGQENELKYISMDVDHKEGKTESAFQVLIKGGFGYKESVQLSIELVYLNEINPLYKTRTFDQNLTLTYKGNYYFYSPYRTLILDTYFVLSNDTRVTETSHTSSGKKNYVLQYYSRDVDSFSFEDFDVIFESNIPFFVVTYLERNIAVSHFGAVCVQENIDLHNQAGKLVGPNKLRTLEEENWWYTFLPSSAFDVKYYDSLGHNFKIHVHNLEDQVTVKFQPRFLLLSGWKTSYTLSYCLPIYEYLYHDFEDNFVLQMRAIDNVLEEFVAKDVVVNVLLPESSEVVDVILPDGFSKRNLEKSYTSLVFYGRPTVVFNGSNLLEYHISDFSVQYKYLKYYTYKSGSIICIYVYSIFLFIIFIVHKTN